jgi:poly(glycerol-phosphate) alpha-glucosyltransferase
MMKIIFGIDYISRKNTGISSLVENLSKHVNKSGHNSYIAAIEDQFSTIDKEKFKCSELLLLKKGIRIAGSYGLLKGYLKFFLKSNADIAHIHSLWSLSSIAVYFWSIITHRPYIISTNGMLNQWALDQSKLKKQVFLALIFKRIIRRADSIILNSIAEKDFLESKGWHTRYHVIPNGVTVPSLSKNNNRITTEKTLLFLSRIHEKKGIDLLLDAWSELYFITKKKGWKLKVVGFLDTENNEYEKFIASKIMSTLTLSNVSTSYGKFGQEMWNEYQNSDAFILPTFSEGSAMVVLNAWSVGKICITTLGSNLEIGLDRECTILIHPTVESIKEGILKLLSLTDVQLNDFGQTGKKLVEDNYSWDKIVDGHIQIYENAIRSCEIRKVGNSNG